jgi:hypothetical protein
VSFAYRLNATRTEANRYVLRLAHAFTARFRHLIEEGPVGALEVCAARLVASLEKGASASSARPWPFDEVGLSFRPFAAPARGGDRREGFTSTASLSRAGML